MRTFEKRVSRRAGVDRHQKSLGDHFCIFIFTFEVGFAVAAAAAAATSIHLAAFNKYELKLMSGAITSTKEEISQLSWLLAITN